MSSLRLVLWTAAMAYAGFLMTGQGLRTFSSLSITEASLGALDGFLLGVMFALREKRRRRFTLTGNPVAQFFPNWVRPPESRGSDPKPKS